VPIVSSPKSEKKCLWTKNWVVHPTPYYAYDNHRHHIRDKQPTLKKLRPKNYAGRSAWSTTSLVL
jgi:hypothetical protein